MHNRRPGAQGPADCWQPGLNSSLATVGLATGPPNHISDTIVIFRNVTTSLLQSLSTQPFEFPPCCGLKMLPVGFLTHAKNGGHVGTGRLAGTLYAPEQPLILVPMSAGLRNELCRANKIGWCPKWLHFLTNL